MAPRPALALTSSVILLNAMTFKSPLHLSNSESILELFRGSLTNQYNLPGDFILLWFFDNNLKFKLVNCDLSQRAIIVLQQKLAIVVSVVIVTILVLCFTNRLLISGLNFILHQIMYLERLLIPFLFFCYPYTTSSGNKNNIFLIKEVYSDKLTFQYSFL